MIDFAKQLTQAELDIVQERRRQVEVKGWTPEHDDRHEGGEIAGAAACYIMENLLVHAPGLRAVIKKTIEMLWPWAHHWWKPKDRRRNLVKAGALIIAEIERFDRAAARERGET
ncbi:hypothetical protein CWB41_13890 [Methylovirgula ligni]|uniref:Uncharacterized protein n=1 Tax=Methylovirgula ligni TaxID=569860 RepID=A0A3D9YL60_9HYPH|nr:hypothetical protein [Methylovirgula ligni]QAY96685.1 hypothetical protein CWB41_13890 [Methylovirgula ligni]REF83274.1 hypothetical protein DES32_3190 [Methylovirgula ligni]